jgi:hypothetical protein
MLLWSCYSLVLSRADVIPILTAFAIWILAWNALGKQVHTAYDADASSTGGNRPGNPSPPPPKMSPPAPRSERLSVIFWKENGLKLRIAILNILFGF